MANTDAGETSRQRPLEVTDALDFLSLVKVALQGTPDAYKRFVKLLRDCKSRSVGTEAVIENVSTLFKGHPNLIQGFNIFLPEGYQMGCTVDGLTITVTTPTSVITRIAKGNTTLDHAYNTTLDVLHAPNNDISMHVGGTSLQTPLAFTQYFRTHTAKDSAKYAKFLEALRLKASVAGESQDFSTSSDNNCASETEFLRRIARLSRDVPGIDREFLNFLPKGHPHRKVLRDLIASNQTTVNSSGGNMAHNLASAVDASVATKRKRSHTEIESERLSEGTYSRTVSAADESSRTDFSNAFLSAPPSLASNVTLEIPPTLLNTLPLLRYFTPTASIRPSQDDLFFSRVKAALGNQETYHEFLKLVNLFTQNVIDAAWLVRESRSFLGEGELLEQFKETLSWSNWAESAASVEHVWLKPRAVLDRPSIDQLNSRYGSYRKLPADEIGVPCSGRDDLCYSVLNDEWASQPTFATEDTVFQAHKKNVYEEALHRSEEERHEYDFYIFALERTIQLLETLNTKLGQLSSIARRDFRLQPNLDGYGKGIHLRVLKKLYGSSAGQAVYQELHKRPADAIPPVLERLKPKLMEWRRAQTAWDKIWRELDAQNYHKSLDHQAISFKVVEKKALTARSLVSQIEAANDEQVAAWRRASTSGSQRGGLKPQYQLEYAMDDLTILGDSLELSFSYLDHMSINAIEKNRIQTFLRTFISLFFVQELTTMDASCNPQNSDVDRDVLGDLRTIVSRQSSGSSREAISNASTFSDLSIRWSRRRYTFFCNTYFYALIRLIEITYSRLASFKMLSKSFDEETSESGLQPCVQNRYRELLILCKNLFSAELDQPTFEERLHSLFGLKVAYIMFTVDRVVGSLVKQAQHAISDTASQQLLHLLRRDRGISLLTAQDQMHARRNAESIVGPDENLFRIDWLPENRRITMQLLGKDDSGSTDCEVVTGRWQAYVTSFMKDERTIGLPASSHHRRPFLLRARRPLISPPRIATSGSLQVKICVRTYRLFFVSNTAESLLHLTSRQERADLHATLRARENKRRQWLRTFLEEGRIPARVRCDIDSRHCPAMMEEMSALASHLSASGSKWPVTPNAMGITSLARNQSGNAINSTPATVPTTASPSGTTAESQTTFVTAVRRLTRARQESKRISTRQTTAPMISTETVAVAWDEGTEGKLQFTEIWDEKAGAKPTNVLKCPFLGKCQGRTFHQVGLFDHMTSSHSNGFNPVNPGDRRRIRSRKTNIQDFWKIILPNLDLPYTLDVLQGIRSTLNIPPQVELTQKALPRLAVPQAERLTFNLQAGERVEFS